MGAERPSLKALGLLLALAGAAGLRAESDHGRALQSVPEVEALAEAATGSRVAGASPWWFRVEMPGGDAEVRLGAVVVGAFFEAEGIAAREGRVLASSDERPFSPPVAVVSQRLWSRIAGDVPLDERTLVFNGRPYRIVGVVPDTVVVPQPTTDIWTTVAAEAPETLNVVEARFLCIVRDR